MTEDVREELLPRDEASPAPDPVREIAVPETARNTLPETEKDESDKINVASKEKDLSIHKNITHAFKCDEADQWIKSTFREVDAMINNNVWEVPEIIPKNARIINSILV